MVILPLYAAAAIGVTPLRAARFTSAPRAMSRCATDVWLPSTAKNKAVAPARFRALSGAPRASRRSTIARWPNLAAWLSGRAPNRSRASTDAPPSSSSATESMQFPSTAENSVNDTSIAVICGLVISNRRPSSWHRSDSAARAIDTAPSMAITIEHKKTIWRYKAFLRGTLLHCSMCGCHEVGTAASLCQHCDGTDRDSHDIIG